MKVLVCFALLVRQLDAARKIVDPSTLKAESSVKTDASHAVSDVDEEAYGLLEEEELQAAGDRFLSVLEMLKMDPNNKTLQSDYRSLVGEVEWASALEEDSFKPDGEDEQPDEKLEEAAAAPLGEMSEPGQQFSIAELVDGLKKKFGRLFTHQRDYVVEGPGMGETKYILEGKTLSLHNRMYVSDTDLNQKYVVRRSFSYLNPVAINYGQYSYRVLECIKTGSTKCREGKVLYTITKDRFGRGLMFGRDEWRVFSGLGGCKRWSSGLFSCNRDNQIMYSLSSGVSKLGMLRHKYYKGPIASISLTYVGSNVGSDQGVTNDGTKIGPEELEEKYQVAQSDQTSGPTRLLHMVGKMYLSPGLKALIWHDAYKVKFSKSTDSLLTFLLQAVQDLTNDVRRGGH